MYPILPIFSHKDSQYENQTIFLQPKPTDFFNEMESQSEKSEHFNNWQFQTFPFTEPFEQAKLEPIFSDLVFKNSKTGIKSKILTKLYK